ncbi:cyclic peptide transporter [Pseudoalteromonas maricaloris]|uniref:cyclic peptide export ABC transporter n=1 Tax=Pseudoalteromonas maricaloris TaxID=184924 RepID=UPI0021AD7B0D|nr:cyclic peptide export ABC transporter [Pseudoalteromonas flavipulchra]USE71043.1 cyclic peptide transporter [Pseudoalteromonas flavipulchra]
MKLFDAFIHRSPNKLFAAIVFGSLAGVAYSLLIPIVLNSITGDSRFVAEDTANAIVFGIEVANQSFATAFLIICLFIFFARTFSQITLTRLALDVTSDLRKDIYQNIAKASLINLENVGSPKLLATITKDVEDIMRGVKVLPDLIISMVTIVSMLSFLLLLNAEAFGFVLAAILFGALTYQIPMLIGRNYFIKARERVDDLHEGIRGLIYGAKELKLNTSRKEHYHQVELNDAESGLIKTQKTALAIVRSAMNYGDLIGFFVIGVITFVFVNYSDISSEELIGVIMAMLYVTGPVGSILNTFPELSMAKVSLRKITHLRKLLAEEAFNESVEPIKPWQSITVENLRFIYPSQEEDTSFSVGPVSLQLKKGQVTFIVGGNGSGKSTLGKMLTMHYLPTAGSISFDDVEVTKDNINSYRQCISSIYSDYYLFQSLHGLGNKLDEDKVQKYLTKLKLQDKVTIENGRFSTLKLSDGQRKRLALLVAYLEEKDLYLFDEWAADQDPDFKHFFYYELLKELREAGKAVIVISHDDRYFDLADQVIVMERGLRRDESSVTIPTEAPEEKQEEFV